MTPHTDGAARLPLEGVRVLDLTGLLPGPFATLILADMGAEVIKVESRLGDLMRQVPPILGDESAYFLSINRSKKSLGLDLRRAGARDAFRDLVAASDVLVEGFRPGRVRRLGIGPDEMLAVNGRLIYCSISGFGQSGPERDRSGHDLTYVARSGILSLKDPLSDAAAPPIQMADLAAGTVAAYAICAALFDRERTGKGAFIDLAILDVMASWMGVHLLASEMGLAGGELMGRYPFYALYRTLDGRQVALGALEPAFWSRFCRAVGRPDLERCQFADGEARAEVFTQLEGIFASRTTDDWRALIREHDLAAEVVAEVQEVPSDEHLRARGVFFDLETGVNGPILQVRTPVRFGSTPGASSSPPRLGADTRSVLGSLGYDEATIEGLLQEGAAFENVELGRRIAPGELP